MQEEVKIQPNKCLYRNSEHREVSLLCLEECHVLPQCTGVIAESTNTTTWCCLVDENPVPVTSGTNVLYLRKDARPQCAFGYDPGSNCSECVQGEGQRWAGKARLLNSFHDINFRFTFGGVNCSSVRGQAEGLPIQSGTFDRETNSLRMETWMRRFQATLSADGRRMEGSSTIKLNSLTKQFQASYVNWQ